MKSIFSSNLKPVYLSIHYHKKEELRPRVFLIYK